MKLGGRVNFWVLSLKLNAIRAKKGRHQPLFDEQNLVIMPKAVFSDSTNMNAGLQMKMALIITFDVLSSSWGKSTKLTL